MLKLLIIVSAFCFHINSGIDTNQIDNSKLALNIMFRDNFKHDVVSLEINGKQILDNELLDSNTSGFANIEIDVIRKSNSQLKIDYLKQKQFIAYSNRLCLILTLNKKKIRYNVYINRGKYIEINKKENNTVYFRQSRTPYVWD